MIHKILIAAGVLALCACATVDAPTTVAEASAAAATAEAPEAPEAPRTSRGDQVICKGDRTTGTRIRRDPVCKTAREWEIIANETTQWVDERRNNTGGGSDPFAGGN